jgi:hypothetical protein
LAARKGAHGKRTSDIYASCCTWTLVRGASIASSCFPSCPRFAIPWAAGTHDPILQDLPKQSKIRVPAPRGLPYGLPYGLQLKAPNWVCYHVDHFGLLFCLGQDLPRLVRGSLIAAQNGNRNQGAKSRTKCQFSLPRLTILDSTSASRFEATPMRQGILDQGRGEMFRVICPMRKSQLTAMSRGDRHFGPVLLIAQAWHSRERVRVPEDPDSPGLAV